MISIIICSVNQEYLKQISENIASTIGVTHEIIGFDNREKKWGICKVYNHCAERAIYPFLCFIHEDMLLSTKKWGELLINFYNSTDRCGVIGFAGGKYVSRNHIDWEVSNNLSRISCRRYNNNDTITLKKNFINAFEEAIIIDGMFIFVSKHIWKEVKFDQQTFSEFHLYDSDFSFGVSQNYNNYVCGVIDNTHYCVPKFNSSFCHGLLLFHSKWKDKLPANKYQCGFFDRLIAEFMCSYRFLLILLKNNFSFMAGIKVLNSNNSVLFLFFFFLFLLFFIPIKLLSKIKILRVFTQ
jgi:hypothetical protein